MKLRLYLASAALLDPEVIVIGGKVRKNTMAMVDSDTIAALEPISVDTLFISTDGLSPAKGLTTPYRQEAGLKQAMIQSARRVVAGVEPSTGPTTRENR